MNLNNISLKILVKSPCDIKYVSSGGVVTYVISTEDHGKYQFDIDLSDKHDVGESAAFLPHYDRSLILMRWIRRALDTNTIYKV